MSDPKDNGIVANSSRQRDDGKYVPIEWNDVYWMPIELSYAETAHRNIFR